jgi:DNA-binding SARP family transcriptional activator/tetratricopeptide (TPR) repeat protein
MDFRLLGAMEIKVGDRLVPLPRRQERLVLAVLLLEAGRPVAAERLVALVWPQARPAGARSVLRTYVSRLRATLATEGGPAIVHRGDGYLAEVPAESVDVHRFDRLVDRAEDTSSPERRSELLREALGLWRGPALADIGPDEVRAPLVVRLDQRRAQALAARIDADLAAGRHAALLPELAERVAQAPADEGLAARLMLALHRSGRRAASLAEFRRITAVLRETLGLDPGAELRDLHAAILRDDDGLRVAAPPAAEPVRPAQLPPDVRCFSGRARELARLDELLTGGDSGPVVISAVSGTAGVGKTALAVHWAHGVADRFPDGQLYLDLRGFDPAGSVMEPLDAAGHLLDALLDAPRHIPATMQSRTALFRSLLAGRRLLVVLDNARDSAHVRDLLPAMPGCPVVVTSRDRLTGLVATHGARTVGVDLLSEDEARALLAERLGRARVEAEQSAVRRIVAACAQLPLALTIVAARAEQTGFALEALAAELDDATRRFDALDAGDPSSRVRAVFASSYDTLSPSAARLFRLVGAHPGADIATEAAAALIGEPVPEARRLLTELHRASLLTEHAPGRHSFHDLLRAYAIDRAEAGESRAALTRVLDYYVAATEAATKALRAAGATPADPVAAAAWLGAERSNLVAATVHAANNGWPSQVIDLAATLFRYLDSGYFTDAVTVHGHACEVGRQGGDTRTLAHALTNLGIAHWCLDQYDLCRGHLEEALALFEQDGDVAGQARARSSLGMTAARLGDGPTAAEHYRAALALFQELGDRAGEARALNNIGALEGQRGRHDQAAGHLTEAMAFFQEAGDRIGEARSLCILGDVLVRAGRYEEAGPHLWRSLTLHREVGDLVSEAFTLDNLGALYRGIGLPQQAILHHRDALALFRKIGYRYGEACALNGLGEAEAATCDHQAASVHHTAAHHLASEIGDDEQLARSLAGLAHVLEAADDTVTAITHLRRSLDLYTRVGLPEAAEVRTRLEILKRADGRAGPRQADAQPGR